MAVFLKAARVAAVSAAMASMGLSSPVAAMVCAKPGEFSAMQVRVLQSDLMVAALTCDARNSYNSFVRKFEPTLVGHGQALRGYFYRTHGKGGPKQLNKYVTSLANEASTRRLDGGASYCRSARKLFDQVLRLKASELTRFAAARHVASESSAPVCPLKSAATNE